MRGGRRLAADALETKRIHRTWQGIQNLHFNFGWFWVGARRQLTRGHYEWLRLIKKHHTGEQLRQFSENPPLNHQNWNQIQAIDRTKFGNREARPPPKPKIGQAIAHCRRAAVSTDKHRQTQEIYRLRRVPEPGIDWTKVPARL